MDRSEPRVRGVWKGVQDQKDQLVADVAADRDRAGRSGLEELYERHSRDAESLAYLLTGDPFLAEDVAQEAFIRAAGRFRHLRNADAFGHYLRRTVVNLCRSHFRHLKVERTYLRREGSAEEAVEMQPGVELGGELMYALRCLPYRQRAAVVLRYFEDLPEDDVAEAMRCSRRAVNGLVSRALATLRRHLKDVDR